MIATPLPPYWRRRCCPRRSGTISSRICAFPSRTPTPTPLRAAKALEGLIETLCAERELADHFAALDAAAVAAVTGGDEGGFAAAEDERAGVREANNRLLEAAFRLGEPPE